LDSQKDVPGSRSDACASSHHDGDQAVNIKVEELSDMEDEQDPAPMTFVEIKAEHEVSFISLLCTVRPVSQPEVSVLLCICDTKFYCLVNRRIVQRSFLTYFKMIAFCCLFSFVL
jgi:hypothetical protein